MIVRMHHAPFAKKLRGKRTVKENTVLEMRNIHKSFPGVRALKGVDFTLCEGEIHALMGENGAGKSTLIKVLTGVYGKDEGQVYIKGQAQAVRMRKNSGLVLYIRKLRSVRIFLWQRICI